MGFVHGKWETSIMAKWGRSTGPGTQARLGRQGRGGRGLGCYQCKQQAPHLGRDPNSRIIFFTFFKIFILKTFKYAEMLVTMNIILPFVFYHICSIFLSLYIYRPFF